MDYSITIPESLVPGIIATATLESERLGEAVTPQMVVQDAAIKQAEKVCQDLRVGPFFRGPQLPQFNADGTYYEPEVQP
jgi:hypothetical protein